MVACVLVALAALSGAGCTTAAFGVYLAKGASRKGPATVAPRPAASNPELEAKILVYLNGRHRSERYQLVILRSVDWVPLRHEATGVVVGRVQPVSAGARWPDGHCTFQDFELAQDFDGQRFMEPLGMHGIGEQWEAQCTALDPAPPAGSPAPAAAPPSP